MRLFFDDADIDAALFLKAAAGYGVGAVAVHDTYLFNTGKTAMVAKVDVQGNAILDKGGKEILVEAPVFEERRRVKFSLLDGEGDVDAARKFAEDSGLVYAGQDDEVDVRRNKKLISPKV